LLAAIQSGRRVRLTRSKERSSADLAPASPTVIDTPLVPLDAQGNAEFSGSFSSSTAGCSAMDVAFLVRTAGSAWIGNGSVRVP
jgi:hypothetical protein